jgi:hypothetical protein
MLDAQNPKLAQTRSTLVSKVQAAQSANRAALAGARMAADKYSGSAREQLKAEMARLYEARNRGEKVARVVITSSGWVDNEVKETVEKDGKLFLVKRPVKDIQTQIAAQVGPDRYRVFAISFRRNITGGKLGPVEYHGIGESFEMLKENIGL